MLSLSATDRNIKDVVLLRYVLIIAVSYLVIAQHESGAVSPAAACLVAAALASNVILGWVRPRRFSPLQVAGIIVVGDTIWISLALALIGHLSGEFFFLYFFVLFFAALAENLVLMLVGVLAASGAYMWVLGHLHPGSVWTQAHLLQIAFLFSAALFYGILVNRTRVQRREAELMEAADRERTELLASLAHDIGGPAHVITLGIEALKGTMEPDENRELGWLLSSVSRNSRYLGDLVSHFLEYSRLRSGRYQLKPGAVSVRNVIASIVQQNAVNAQARGVALRLAVDEIPPAVADELALVRIIQNLIGNALRYSESGTTISIEASLDDEMIRITVGDSGPGIAPEQRAQIGQPFVAAPRTHNGAGLGLFIVRSLVEAHGGSLAILSEAGKGTMFTVRIPFVAAGEGALVAGAEHGTEPGDTLPAAGDAAKGEAIVAALQRLDSAH
jgi:signal transduction histidine kinase